MVLTYGKQHILSALRRQALCRREVCEALDKYQPEYVVVWGKRLWDKMPGERWQDGEPIVVDGCSTATGAYLLNNGRRVKTMAVNHPSVGYSWDYWYRVLEKFFLH